MLDRRRFIATTAAWLGLPSFAMVRVEVQRESFVGRADDLVPVPETTMSEQLHRRGLIASFTGEGFETIHREAQERQEWLAWFSECGVDVDATLARVRARVAGAQKIDTFISQRRQDAPVSSRRQA